MFLKDMLLTDRSILRPPISTLPGPRLWILPLTIVWIWQLAATNLPATGEVDRALCVEVCAQAYTSPAAMILNWRPNAVGTNHIVYRRNLGDTNWGAGTPLGSNAVCYTDLTVSVGGAYEYRVQRQKEFWPYPEDGYVYAGIEAPLTEYRGKVVLLVDSTFTTSLWGELARLQADLTGDGWTVLRHDVSRSDSVTNIRGRPRSRRRPPAARPRRFKALNYYREMPDRLVGHGIFWHI